MSDRQLITCMVQKITTPAKNKYSVAVYVNHIRPGYVIEIPHVYSVTMIFRESLFNLHSFANNGSGMVVSKNRYYQAVTRSVI